MMLAYKIIRNLVKGFIKIYLVMEFVIAVGQGLGRDTYVFIKVYRQNDGVPQAISYNNVLDT